jgi:hypothetical protein
LILVGTEIEMESPRGASEIDNQLLVNNISCANYGNGDQVSVMENESRKFSSAQQFSPSGDGSRALNFSSEAGSVGGGNFSEGLIEMQVGSFFAAAGRAGGPARRHGSRGRLFAGQVEQLLLTPNLGQDAGLLLHEQLSLTTSFGEDMSFLSPEM